MTKNEVFFIFWSLTVVQLTPKQFVMILLIEIYLLVPKPSLCDLAVGFYDQK